MARISDTDLILGADGSVYHLGLRPDQMANTILAVGDPTRVAEISMHFDTIEHRVQKREFNTHTGLLNGKRISVISTGIGPDNVEIFFNEVDALVNINLPTREPNTVLRSLNIIRVGTSGALQRDIPVGSFVLSDYAAGLDNLMQFYSLPQDASELSIGKELQKITRLPSVPYIIQGSAQLRDRLKNGMMIGDTVTCPGFYAPQGRQVRILIRFPELLSAIASFRLNNFRFTNFEMETSAYFAFGRLLGHHTASASVILANRITGELSAKPEKVVGKLIRQVLDNLV